MLASGTVLRDRYHLTRHLGGGAFGQAYLAEDHDLPGNPWCVVKQFKPQRTDTDSLWTAKRLFDTEAEVLHRLGTHDQIPTLLAHFEEDCEFYLVQDYIEGDDLSQSIQPGQQHDEADVIVLLQDILETLQFVHQEQVIHRDIKPSNLIRRRQDKRIVLIDFGAVKQITLPSDDTTALTIGIGTKGYVPCEQANGRPKPCSDLYAVGILCIQALTGCKPEQLEDPETAEIVWRDRVTVHPQLADILDKMVRYDFRQRYQATAAVLDDLQQLTAALLEKDRPQPVVKNAEVCSQGDLLLELGHYPTALLVYDAFLQDHPDAQNVWRKRGRALSRLGQYQAALQAYDQALQLNSGDAASWFGQGAALQQLNQIDAALAAYDRTLDLDPDYYQAWFNRGLIFSNRPAAEPVPPFQGQASGMLPGGSTRKAADYEMAIAAYDQVLRIKPDYYQAWLNRGFVLTAAQRYSEALAAYEQAIKIKATVPKVWLNQGVVHAHLGQYSDALTAYEQALQLQPDLPEAWVNRGLVLEKLNHYPAAKMAYERAIQLKPGYDLAVRHWNRLMHQSP